MRPVRPVSPAPEGVEGDADAASEEGRGVARGIGWPWTPVAIMTGTEPLGRLLLLALLLLPALVLALTLASGLLRSLVLGFGPTRAAAKRRDMIPGTGSASEGEGLVGMELGKGGA